MKLLKHYIYLLLCIAMTTVVSCKDDLLYNPEYGSGEVTLSATIQFEPQTTALDSRATSGQALRDIESLSVIFYNVQDTVTPIIYNLRPGVDFVVRNRPNLPTDYTGEPAETSTASASFSLPNIQAGNYYVFAVANMGNLTPDKVGTPDQLKHIKLSWDDETITNNKQMFGYFMNGENSLSVGYDNHLVTVSTRSTQIHAWLKRAASKVTVVYDPSNMHNNIDVFIHKVTIFDIPKNCYLGADNRPGEGDELIQGETIYYNTAGDQLAEDAAPNDEDYEKWMRVSRGSGKKGAVSEKDGQTVYHSEESTALYFYENLQGDFSNHPNKDYYDKRQDSTLVGTPINRPDQPDYKDSRPYGTYIEVEGFYNSTHAPIISSGKIKYRFMLGQDTKYDYEAFRNRHYKLTLKFNGYANQADWHIDYLEESPELYVPAKYYVSYLYNQEAVFPIRAKGKCIYLDCEIIENNWAPYDSTTVDEVPAAGPTGPENFQWARETWEKVDNEGEATEFVNDDKENKFLPNKYNRFTTVVDAEGEFSDYKLEHKRTPLHVGFLSLTVPSDYENTAKRLPTGIFNRPDDDYRPYKCTAVEKDSLQLYWEGKSTGVNKNDMHQGKRVYIDVNNGIMPTQGAHGNGRNSYHINNLADTSMTVQLKMWTRPQTMIRISGFSGNNPYEAFQRKAVVRVRAKFRTTKGIVAVVKDVPVFQVRRIVNPKGVWRSWNNNNLFRVLLCHRGSAGSNNYQGFKSEGAWKAYVKATNANDFMRLSGGTKIVGDTIFGDSDTQIDFQINFLGQTDQTESNCAVVNVEYHGYTCKHTILVRQGYNQPLELVDGQGMWSSYSVYAAYHTKDSTYPSYSAQTGTASVELTKSPLAFGTFFKRANLHEGILAINDDTYKVRQSIGSGPIQVTTYANDDPYFTNSTKNGWSSIIGLRYNNSWSMTGFNNGYKWPKMQSRDGTQYDVPTHAQYEALLANCEVGFGILYGDGAPGTVTSSIEAATGYTDYDNTNNDGKGSTKGMRGAIVFNPDNAHQLFFPVGATGFGRRRFGTTGGLQYASVNNPLAHVKNSTGYNKYRPVCYNYNNAPGAIYWFKTLQLTKPDNVIAWDINYNDLNFAPYDYGVAAAGGTDSDALPIRLIVTKLGN